MTWTLKEVKLEQNESITTYQDLIPLGWISYMDSSSPIISIYDHIFLQTKIHCQNLRKKKKKNIFFFTLVYGCSSANEKRSLVKIRIETYSDAIRFPR